MRRPLPYAVASFLVLAVLLLPAARAERPAHPHEIRGASTVAAKPKPPGKEPVPGGGAVLSLLGEIDSLNPFTSSSAAASEIHDLIFPRLFVEEADYPQGPPTFTPNIAESATPGADGYSLKIRLRDCTWSDGEPITADDVRFSWEAAKHPDVAWVSASIVDFIEDVEVHDPRTFTVRYSQKYPYQQMDVNDIQVLPKHTFGRIPFEQWQTHGKWLEQAKVAGGPFLLESMKPNEEVTLVRNPAYWKQGKPYLDKLIFRIIPDQRTQLTSVLAGDVDCMQGVTPKDVDKILDAAHLELYTYMTRSYGYAGWNCKRWPFDDARVRRAMSHAIDVEDIVESLFRGYAQVAGPQIISSFWASNPDIEPVAFDADLAETLLQEAGWTRGADDLYAKDGKPFRFTLLTNSENALRQRICQMIQANLREVGVACEIQPMEFNQMSTQLKRHEFQGYVGGWYVATKVDLKPTWHSTSVDGRFNYVNFQNARVDAIIDEARVMSDFEAARPLWYELQDILHAEQPYTMLYEPRGLVALHERFQGVEMNALRVYANLDEWWVPPAQRRFK